MRHAIAEEVRALLGRRRMSDIALARAIGRSHTYLYRRLTGETAFDVDDLENIAETLGVALTELLPARASRRPDGGPHATTRYRSAGEAHALTGTLPLLDLPLAAGPAPVVTGTVPHPRHPIAAGALCLPALPDRIAQGGHPPPGPRRTAPTGL